VEADPVSIDPTVELGALPTRVIGVAASAGGVEALRRLVAQLPTNLDAAVCVVLHIPPTGRSLLAPILARDSTLTVKPAEHGAPLRAGTIYVAPADHHLLVRADTVELSRGPKENGVRPAADPLFRSLARSWGDCAVAVVLSGALDDGAAGAAAVAAAGGRVVVQDPSDALVPGMPSSTIAVTTPDAIVTIDELGDTLQRLVAAPVPNPGKEAQVHMEPDPAELARGPNRPDGPASGFTCPECNGAIWELREGDLVRYRCRVGHAFSEDAMVEAQGTAVEAALWAALEVLEERGELLRRVANRMDRAPRTEHRFREGAREADERAGVIRRVLSTGRGNSGLSRGDEAEETAAG
jgi:two-component system chemotaxis response regulator CheB